MCFLPPLDLDPHGRTCIRIQHKGGFTSLNVNLLASVDLSQSSKRVLVKNQLQEPLLCYFLPHPLPMNIFALPPSSHLNINLSIPHSTAQNEVFSCLGIPVLFLPSIFFPPFSFPPAPYCTVGTQRTTSPSIIIYSCPPHSPVPHYP